MQWDIDSWERLSTARVTSSTWLNWIVLTGGKAIQRDGLVSDGPLDRSARSRRGKQV